MCLEALSLMQRPSSGTDQKKRDEGFFFFLFSNSNSTPAVFHWTGIQTSSFSRGFDLWKWLAAPPRSRSPPCARMLLFPGFIFQPSEVKPHLSEWV